MLQSKCTWPCPKPWQCSESGVKTCITSHAMILTAWSHRYWSERSARTRRKARSFEIKEGKELQFQAQAFNLFNHANYYVQNGDGINQLQYNPIGSNCGDGSSLNQTCYLVPNSGPGNFGALQEISPNGLPRVLQFSARLTF